MTKINSNESDFTWYLTFISIAFGVFISVWIQPLDDLTLNLNNLLEKSATGEVRLLILIRGIFMFFILICLWWWYGIFLGQVSPAKGFTMYAYDFISLGLFAIAAFTWHRKILFPCIVLIACSFMLGRFALAYKSLPSKSNERKALICALSVIIVTIIFLLGFFIPLKKVNLKDYIILFPLALGAIITITAVKITASLKWGISAPIDFTPIDKLKMILPEIPRGSNIEKEDVYHAMEIASLSGQDFENELRTSNLYNLRSANLSEVHTPTDTEIQAIILSLPSIKKLEEVKAKSLMTFFGHWLDDIFDRGLLSYTKLSIKKNEDLKIEIQKLVNFSNNEKLALFVNKMYTKIGRHKFFDLGISRLAYGSYIFRNNTAVIARSFHNEILKEYLSDKSLLNEFNVEFVDLTTKTVQELWLGLENPLPTFELCFLYSLLYAPALYYHDYNEEIERGELGKSLEHITTGCAAEHIRKVGNYLTNIKDARRALRAMQTRAVGLSFISVLPKDVRTAYEEVAAQLNPPLK